jgi:phosphoglycolate phosphatase-like HAD superfamily hydrolase
MADEQKTIAVDFDGVLNQYTGYADSEKAPPPVKGSWKFLSNLRERGYKVVIHTARNTDEVHSWLKEHGMKSLVDHVTNTKVPAHAYIDDRGIQHNGDFRDTLARLDSFKPHWKK